MEELMVPLSGKNVRYLLDCDFRSYLQQTGSKIVILTDENVHTAFESNFEGFIVIRFPAGEQSKRQSTVDDIIEQMLVLNIDKDSIIAGVGGGVVTDIAGYVASIYKRGITLVQVPTSILAMSDAAIGGKNGVNSKGYKNMIGTIYQPKAVLFDYSLLDTLPEIEWINGFAEIIKHACIIDGQLFEELENKSISDFRGDTKEIARLIKKNVEIKTGIVVKDEFENGDRMLLNFGHTLGHAIEHQLKLQHGFAISIGMVAACRLSEELNNFPSVEMDKVKELLIKYGLPVKAQFDKEALWQSILSDKKRKSDAMNFILLDKIGQGKVSKIPLEQLHDLIEQVL